jgi:hypothetical protein
MHATKLFTALVTLAAAAAGGAAATVAALAQTPAPATRTFSVRETMGIRRTEYPVTAKVMLAKGALADPSHARVTLNDAEVPAQFTAATTWDDGSVQTLEVDLNATLEPEEARRYTLQYGADVAAAARPARPIAVQDAGDAVQIGNVKFAKSGSPLIASATFRGEGIAPGSNGVVVTDANGQRHDLASAAGAKMEIVKRGPLVGALHYTAALPIDANYSVPVDVRIEMPVSKTWIKVAATVTDRSRRLREIAFDTPLAFSAMPVLWDFATDSGTYGVFRNPTDVATLTQTRAAAGAKWTIETGAQDQRRAYETSAGSRVKTASGWGHLQDAKAAVAFGFEAFGQDNGTYSIALDGKGQMSFRFAPAVAGTQHHLTVYEHFVATPVAVGAATNPTAMLNPPVVTVER